MDPQLVNYNGQLINLNGGVLSNKFPIRDGLVFYLDPAVDKCYPDTGTTATDLSPSGITTYVQNGVTFNSDNKGYFDFDGVNDHLKTIGDALDLTHTDKHTINMWFRLDDYNSSVKVMVEHSTNFNAVTGAWTIIHSEYGVDGSLQHSVRGPGIYNISWTDDPYDDNVWHLYSVTYDASLSALDCRTHYIDGEVVAHTQHGSHNHNLNDFGVKKDLYFNCRAGTNYFSNHDLGLFQIYDRVLSQDEIRSIYNHHKQRFEHIITDGLVLNLDAQSKFSYPGTGTPWYDVSPIGNDATLVNGPTYQSDPAAIVFDGVNDYGETNLETSSFINGLTWAGWVRNDAGSAGGWEWVVGGTNQFAASPTNNSYCCFQIGKKSGSEHVRFETGGFFSNTALDAAVPLGDGNWHYLVGTVEDTGTSFTKNIYLDGVKAISQVVTQNANASSMDYGTMTIANQGRQDTSHVELWEGAIAEIHLYNRGLTEEEVQYNFEARRGRYGI